MVKELPHNWVECQLGDILSLRNGYAFKSNEYKGEGVPVIRISDIQQGAVNSKNAVYVDKQIELDRFIIERGDVLVAMSGATTGKYGVYSSDEIAYQNQRVGNFKPHIESLFPKPFVFYLLGGLKKEIEDQAYGGAQPNISSKLIEDLSVSIPPLPEQQRIVAKLDGLFAHLEEVKTRLAKVPELLKQFRQSVLTQAVTGRLTEEWRKEKGLGEWEEVELEKVANVIDPQPSHRTPPIHEDGVPYVSIGDVDKIGRVNLEGARPVSKQVLEEHIKRYDLQAGDFGFGKIGTLGKPFLLPVFKVRTYTLSANIILIQPRSKGNPKFIFYYLDSPIIEQKLREGTTSTSQPAFGIKKARKFPTPNPEPKEQTEIVRRVENLFSKADVIEAKYKVLKAEIDILPQAILAKAFKGELVEQLETDGSAADLLKEIQQLKTEMKKK